MIDSFLTTFGKPVFGFVLATFSWLVAEVASDPMIQGIASGGLAVALTYAVVTLWRRTEEMRKENNELREKFSRILRDEIKEEMKKLEARITVIHPDATAPVKKDPENGYSTLQHQIDELRTMIGATEQPEDDAE